MPNWISSWLIFLCCAQTSVDDVNSSPSQGELKKVFQDDVRLLGEKKSKDTVTSVQDEEEKQADTHRFEKVEYAKKYPFILAWLKDVRTQKALELESFYDTHSS